jgi:hypothetical protein
MREIIVFEQLPSERNHSYVQQLISRLADSARHVGLRVVGLPYDFDDASIDDVLDRLGPRGGALGFFAGFITEPDYYAEVCSAAAKRGIEMINTAEASRTVMEFDRFFPLISDLTARSVIVRSVEDCEQAFRELGSPVFVKGLIKSLKEGGWEACTAHDAEQLTAMLTGSARFPISARGVLIAREILPLRRSGAWVSGFPVSREYRAYVLDENVIGFGFYWKGYDNFGPLSADELETLTSLAQEAATRVTARFVAVDVGQLADGSWIVVELGDPQVSGVAHMSHHVLWHELAKVPRTAP